jgi:fumarylacetoacetate (FAA) hydrolase
MSDFRCLILPKSVSDLTLGDLSRSRFWQGIGGEADRLRDFVVGDLTAAMTDPLMYQGGSDVFLGPRDPIVIAEEAWGIDLEAEVVVVLGDVPMAATRQEALRAIRLLMLVNDLTLRNVTGPELAKGFGFVQSKPSSAFTPVAVTPDELGTAFDGSKVGLPILTFINDQPLGMPMANADMTFDFPTLIMHATKTRALSAGTILGAGTISNRAADGGPGLPVAQGGLGYCCIAEQRTVETIREGTPSTPFLKFGDTVKIEMLDADRRSIFGAIEQKVAPYQR